MNDWLPKAFSDFDGYVATLPEVQRNAVNESFRWSPNPDEDKKRLLGVAYAADKLGIDSEEVSQHFETDYMHRVALDPNGLGMVDPPRDVNEFFDAASKRVKRDGEIAVVANEAAQRAAVDALGADYLPSFSKWQAEAKAKPGYDSQADAEYKRAFDATQTKVAPYKQFINDSVNTLRANMSEDGTQWKDFDFKAAADHILAIPAGDRPFVLDAIGSLGAQKEDKRAFMDKIALAFDRGAADLGSKVAGAASDLLTSKYEMTPQVVKDALASKEDQAAVNAGITEGRNRRVVAQQIRDIATGKISPLTSGNIIGRGLIGASESLPMTAAAFVPYAGPAALVAYFKEDSYLNLRANSPELSDAQAQAISTISAPIQAVTEVISDRLLANRLPSLHRALNSPVLSASGIAARFVGQAALGTATEFAEEKIQNATDPVLQKIGHALSEDMPDVANWNQYMDRFKGGNLDLIAQILPLSLIGAGGATFESVAYSKALGSSSLLLEAAGYQKTDAAKIADAVKSGDTKTAEALMRHGWREIAAGKEAGTVEGVTTEAAQKVMADFRELEAKEQALKDAAFSHLEEVGATLPLRKTVEGWTLTMEDGSAATFATHQEADEARWSHLAETYSIQPAEQIREFIGQAEKAAETGREFVYEFDPKQLTAERAVAEGLTTPEAIAKRSEQAKALSGDDQAYDVARATAAAQGQEQSDVSGVILGSNKDQFKNGVLRSTMRLYQGATPATIVEETLETSARRLLSNNRRDWMEQALREWESVSGDTLFRKTGTLDDSDLIEAWSHFGQSYFLARSKKGDGKALDSWKQSNFRQSMRSLMGTKLSSAMDAMATFLRSVFKRAAKIQKARRDGVLSQELEQEIARQLGLGEAFVHGREAMREAANIASEASDEGLSYTPPSDAPFSFVPTKDTKETVLPDGARLVGPASFSFVAYHGTPHKVDKFSLDKIGTGEGAQVYGWGLYFAESRDVAEEYRRNLSNPTQDPIMDGQRFRKGHPLWDEFDATTGAGINMLARHNGDAEKASREVLQKADEYGISRRDQSVTKRLQVIREWAGRVKSPDTLGNLYTVELLPDEGDFLDWDKPLAEQSEKVRAAIEQEFGKLAQMDMSGGDWHAWITRDDTDAKTLSGDLARIGIKGIRYLDGWSRNAGDGTRNYVIFDESLVRILEENGKPVESNFSFLPGELPAQLESMFDPFKSPEAKARVGMVAKNRVAKIALEWEQVAKQQKKVREIEAQRKEMQARLEDENLAKLTPETHAAFNTPEEQAKAVENPVVAMLVKRDAATKRFKGRLMSYSAAMAKGLDVADQYDDRIAVPAWMYGGTLTPDQAAKELHDENLINGSHASDLWSALDSAFIGAQKTREGIEKAKAAMREAKSSAKAEADAWAAGQRKEQEQRAKALDRGRLLQALRVLDASISALPMEIRGKIGGYVKLASLDTDEARVDAIADRVEKIEREMEKWLKKQFSEQIDKLFDRAREKAGPGKKAKGTIGADAHQLIWAAQEASTLSADEVAGRLADLDTLIASGDLTPEQEALATRQRALVELAGDLKNADSARMEEAYRAIKSTLVDGLLKWKEKVLKKRERRAAIRAALLDDTGKTGAKSERNAQEAHAATWLGRLKDNLLSISSFSEVVRFVFGDSTTARTVIDEERRASNQYEDAVEAMGADVADLFTRLAGSEMKGERLRYDMAQPTIKAGNETLSELGAIQALLMWRQEDGRKHMEGAKDESGLPSGSWHYDQSFIDEIERQMSPQAQVVMAWIGAKYAAEHPALNALYRERHGVNLPGHSNYAPITVKPMQAKAGEMTDPVSGASVSGSILTPGSLRTRNKSAVAEPEFRDALATYIAHTRQMEHWKAYYDFAVETQAVIGNRELGNAIEAKAGKKGLTALRKWSEAFAQGGMRDAASGLASTELLSQWTNQAATVGLLGRVSTLLVQSTQLAAASVKMPTGAYLVRFGKLMAGQLAWGDAIKSDFIQRRIKAASPIVRQAMQSLGDANKPNAIKHAVRHLGKLLSGADGLFTAGTYAILLDYHRQTARDLGLTGAEAEKFAHEEATRATEDVAQPTRMANRSLAEITATHPLSRVTWAYASEARQKIALTAWAAANAKANPATAAKAAFLTFIVGGLVSQVLKNLWREAKGDDDEGKWSAARLTMATLSGPAGGIPGVASLLDSGNMLSGLDRGKGAAKRLLTLDETDHIQAMKDVESILSAAGLFSDTVAAVAAMSHAGVDGARLLENALDHK